MMVKNKYKNLREKDFSYRGFFVSLFLFFVFVQDVGKGYFSALFMSIFFFMYSYDCVKNEPFFRPVLLIFLVIALLDVLLMILFGDKFKLIFYVVSGVFLIVSSIYAYYMAYEIDKQENKKAEENQQKE